MIHLYSNHRGMALVIMKVVLCILSCVIIVTKGIEDSNTQLNWNLREKLKAVANLQVDVAGLVRDINNEEAGCNETISHLMETHTGLLDKIKNNNKILADLLNKIYQEELKHEVMERKLKTVYEELEIVGFVYEITYQDAMFLLHMRTNGTALECQAIARSEFHSTDRDWSPRILNSMKTSKESRKVMILRNKVREAELEEAKLVEKYKHLMMLRDSNKQLCDLKIFDLRELISYTEYVLQYSHDAVETMKTDLEVSVVLSESLTLEIKFGETLMHSITENIKAYRKLKESFDEDEACYVSIKNWSM
uniref:Uncharacterized protein n=1 Tax=Cuerna arida TaxID=1464854 RepID=A0A1B6EKP6_9HEMI